ncbi:hypothetical protein RD1_3329 [Roseobacter denitrificans OCh 114]|uniref:PH domain-containing protein n=1 Tax=Roseobacter denitrificans (strain ATCC 33942 / OCh 114) TaxID=375451 RepID=Q163L5_ROSDO|nr:hypothetical protein RD1_3329 [Roseobacter denitrificans OCh 114]
MLILLSITVDAAPWLMLAVAAFTLPALWELYSNPASGLDFRPDRITWFTGRRQAAINWCEIDRFRLDTRLDFSVRATAVLTSGRKIRLPYECTPHHALLEAALNARGVRTERHHFSLIG